MGDVLALNLIQLFTFYLTAAFVLSTFRRLRQYHDVVQLAVNAPQRWPRVLKQIKEHHVIFLTWATLRPLLLAVVLLTLQWLLSRVVFPRARLSGDELLREWWMWVPLALTGAAMLAVDGYGIVRVGSIGREETEKYLDEAEHWLTSWKAPLVKIVTLGYINPRHIVGVEVRKALEESSSLLNQALWWVSLQAGCRLLFGLALWLSWAMLPQP